MLDATILRNLQVTETLTDCFCWRALLVGVGTGTLFWQRYCIGSKGYKQEKMNLKAHDTND